MTGDVAADVPPRLVPLLNAIAGTISVNSEGGHMPLQERYRIADALLKGPLSFVGALSDAWLYPTRYTTGINQATDEVQP